MAGKKKGGVPKLCHHKATGRAYVTDPATRAEIYLGPWGLAETAQNYAAYVAQLGARREEVASAAPAGTSVSVAQLALDYLAWAEAYYTKRGKQTSEVACVKAALLPLVELFGPTPAAEFGPAKLKAVRRAYLEKPLSRTRKRKVRQPDGTTRVEEEVVTRAVGYSRCTTNKMVQRVRRLFRWGVEQELVPPAVLVALEAVADLAEGRTSARETADVAPVPDADLHKTLAVLRDEIATLVRLQVLLACRPDELLSMRPCDLERATTPWAYTPQTHKTAHQGRERVIHVGPQARALLQPLLDRGGPEDRPLFASQGRGHRRRYRGRLTVSGYRLAVVRACKRAGVAHWTPARLRHNGLTLARAAAGLEAAQAIGGHAEVETTQIYAERLTQLARETVERIG